MTTDTIYALSTPPGKGGIAVIRVSGPAALDSYKALAPSAPKAPAPRTAIFCKFTDSVSRETIDSGLVMYFKAPTSFTGEDIMEFHIHGGMAVVRSMLAALSSLKGYRLAEAGEFTRRAFENGKMDLTQAEAVADLIDAETALQKAQALSQLGGGLSALYAGWADSLKAMLAHLEADLEFPDEDLPEGLMPQIMPELQILAGEIAAHLNDNRRGERLREGVQVAVIGAPNAGKSTLVNALAQRDIAIVSEHAGTTRDVIEAHLDLGGYPVILADTAGLRPEQLGGGAQDSIESEGIRRALARAGQADIKLLVFDAAALPALDAHTKALIDERAIIVFNKADLAPAGAPPFKEAILLSAKAGTGMESLVSALIEKAESLIGTAETPSLTRQRHRQALGHCLESLKRTQAARLPELAAEDVRLALRHLGRITGKVDVEDLLDVIFRDFCIGK